MKIKRIVISTLATVMIANFLLLTSLAVTKVFASRDTASSDSLPSQYCLRDEYVVYAQNQDKHGYCWNFASTMAASTTIMKATGEYYDFSELWTAVSLYATDSSFSKMGQGGSISMHYESVRESGLMLETDLPYKESFVISNENAVDYYNFYESNSNSDLASAIVSDRDSTFKTDQVDEIKNHIYNHGSVYMSFTFSKGFVESGGAYYLPPNQTSTTSSHAVSVIGWDDNFEREVYLNGSSTPTVFKGAWIILNSYTETSGNDGISLVFYDDENVDSIKGYRYEPDTSRDLYFYDKIESGYSYITNLKGKYYGDFTAEVTATKQKNIFYDDVALEYSYIISDGASVENVAIYLDGHDVTHNFDVRIDNANKRFYVSGENAAYGQYKMLVTYGNGEKSSEYLNNFFVTHGLMGEEIEYDYSSTSFAFNPGRDLEFYSFISSDKTYVIYTDSLKGEISFLPTEQSVYSEKNMSIPTVSYEITDGKSCTSTYTIKSDSGYELNYNFVFEYCADTSLQTVNVYYDLGGGVNHINNYSRELAGPTTALTLYEPTRPGYTFAGWYLDYGNGSQRISEADGVYYVSWDDIHHMGENPTMNASSYYKQYYKNSNTLFVYARWEEEDYHNVEISITGEGESQIDERISLCSRDSVRYLFLPKGGYCLSNLTVNGVAVSSQELIEISTYGLVLKNLKEDVTISATFSKGVYLHLEYGDNIKSAYVIAKKHGRVFRDGDVIPTECFQTSNNNPLEPNFPIIGPFHGEFEYSGSDDMRAITLLPVGSAEFTVVVELFDDTYAYTYSFDDGAYTLLENGTYTKDIVFSLSDSFREVNVGNATKKSTGNVKLNYEVGDYVLDHYISSDIDATSGEKNSAICKTGETVYLFVKLPEDTDIYRYEAPDTFSAIGDGWYRMAVSVGAEDADIGVIKITQELQSYTVTWLNWDGSVIYTEDYLYGEIPVFKGEGDATNPTKNSDGTYSYVFAEWDKAFDAVTADATYTATFSAVLLEYSIFAGSTENGTVTPSRVQTATPLGEYTYTFTPAEGYIIADVILNGESIGAVSSYTFSGVRADQYISVVFEKERQAPEKNRTPLIVLIVVLAIVLAGSVSGVVLMKKRKPKAVSEQIEPDANDGSDTNDNGNSADAKDSPEN